MAIYKGIVEGMLIRIKDKVLLPEGTEVEIIVKETLQTSRKGAPSSILKAIQSIPPLSKESADELRQAIKEGKTGVDWSTPFDSDEHEGV